MDLHLKFWDAGLSLELGEVISEDVTSTYSDWTLIVSGATGKNDILVLSPFPLHISPKLYLIHSEQFSSQQGLPYPNILFCQVYQNDWYTPCIGCGHTPIYNYAMRRVMMFSLLN